jgi:hypothetical protein
MMALPLPVAVSEHHPFEKNGSWLASGTAAQRDQDGAAARYGPALPWHLA